MAPLDACLTARCVFCGLELPGGCVCSPEKQQIARRELGRDWRMTRAELATRRSRPSVTERDAAGLQQPFVGRPIVALFGGRCCVCGRGYAAGRDILWDGPTKRAAHHGCGQAGEADGRR